LPTELGEEISQGSVGEAETFSDGLQRLLVDDDRPQGFVAALLWVGGIEKELLDSWIVHDEISWMSCNYGSK
jgi:hypothetical protein